MKASRDALAAAAAADSLLAVRRQLLESAMNAVSLRRMRAHSDTELAEAWWVATGDASKAALTESDSAWIDAVIAEVRRRDIRPWLDDRSRAVARQDADVPPYTVVFRQRMIAPSGVLVEFVVPSLSRNTPNKEIERVAFAIMRREGGDMAIIYATRAAFRANEDRAYGTAHPGALERGYLGRIEGAVFRPSPH